MALSLATGDALIAVTNRNDGCGATAQPGEPQDFFGFDFESQFIKIVIVNNHKFLSTSVQQFQFYGMDTLFEVRAQTVLSLQMSHVPCGRAGFLALSAVGATNAVCSGCSQDWLQQTGLAPFKKKFTAKGYATYTDLCFLTTSEIEE